MSEEDISVKITQYDVLLQLNGLLGPPGPPGAEGPPGAPGIVELHGGNTFDSLIIDKSDPAILSVIDASVAPLGSLGGSGVFTNATVQFDKLMTLDHIEAVLAVTARATGYIPTATYEKIGISSQVVMATPSGHWGVGSSGPGLQRASAAIPYLGQGIISTVSTNVTGVPGTAGTPGLIAAHKGATAIRVISTTGFFNAAGESGNFIIPAPITLTRCGVTDVYRGLMVSYTNFDGITFGGLSYRDPRSGEVGIGGQAFETNDIPGLPGDLKYGELICAVGYAEGGLFETVINPLSDGVILGLEIGSRNAGSVGVMDSASEKAGIYLGTHEDQKSPAAEIKKIRTAPSGLVRITAELPARPAHGFCDKDSITIDTLFGAYAVLNADYLYDASVAGSGIRLVSEHEFDLPGTLGLHLADWDSAQTVVSTSIVTPVNCLWDSVGNAPGPGSTPFNLDVNDASGFTSATLSNYKSTYVAGVQYIYTGRVVGPGQNKLTGCYAVTGSGQNRSLHSGSIVNNAGQALRSWLPPTWAITTPKSHETWQNGINLRGIIDTFIKISMPSGLPSGINPIGIDMPNDPDPDFDWGNNADAIILPNEGGLKAYTTAGQPAHLVRLALNNTVHMGSPNLDLLLDGSPILIGSLNPGDLIYVYGAFDMTGHRLAHVGTPVAADQAANKGYVDAAGSIAQSGLAVNLPSTSTLVEQRLVGPIVIPAKSMGKNGRLVVVLNVARNNGGAGTVTVNLRLGASGSGLGGALVQQGVLSVGNPYAVGRAEIYNRNSLSQQSSGPGSGGNGTLFAPYGANSNSQFGSTINSDADMELNIYGKLSHTGDNITIQGYQVLVFYSD